MCYQQVKLTVEQLGNEKKKIRHFPRKRNTNQSQSKIKKQISYIKMRNTRRVNNKDWNRKLIKKRPELS